MTITTANIIANLIVSSYLTQYTFEELKKNEMTFVQKLESQKITNVKKTAKPHPFVFRKKKWGDSLESEFFLKPTSLMNSAEYMRVSSWNFTFYLSCLAPWAKGKESRNHKNPFDSERKRDYLLQFAGVSTFSRFCSTFLRFSQGMVEFKTRQEQGLRGYQCINQTRGLKIISN